MILFKYRKKGIHVFRWPVIEGHGDHLFIRVHMAYQSAEYLKVPGVHKFIAAEQYKEKEEKDW